MYNVRKFNHWIGYGGESTILLYDVALWIIENNNSSINAIQIEFELGFNHVVKLINIFIMLGILSENNVEGKREILVDKNGLIKIFKDNELLVLEKDFLLEILNKDKKDEFCYWTEYKSESTSFLYDVALWVIENNNPSINAIQNQFGIGFNRCQKIIQMLKEFKILSEERKILISKDELMITFKKNNLFLFTDDFLKLIDPNNK